MYKFDYEEFEKACEQRAKERKDKELSDLRDHFAGLAVQGMLSSNHFVNNGAIALSQDAYIIADAMLKQRSLTND